MIKILQKLFGGPTYKNYQKKVDQINELEEGMKKLSDTELSKQTEKFKQKLEEGDTLDDILVEVFATIREVTRRTMEMRHYDVQLIGGIVLHEGKIAEMRTGEGKTLMATLPIYLNALSGEGVHVITVNDYLAKRDAVWMAQIYAFLGLSVGVVNSQGKSYLYDETFTDKADDEERDEVGSFKVEYEFLRPSSKKESYAADITYGTNNEFGFDYLRDNTTQNKEYISQREHAFAIVDEIDSILIDEARTPLILSMPAAESEDFYKQFSEVAAQLKEGEDADYVKDEKFKSVALTDDGITKAEDILGLDNIYTEKGIKYVHHLETALRAKALFTRDKEYVVNNGEVIIVDPSTGRMQPGRRWSEGLHQAVEAKEGVPIQRESKTMASITFQNYFKFYKKLSGMTGTAETSSEEFFKVYGLDVIVIPTHRPIARLDNSDQIFRTQKGKFMAIARKIAEVHETGQPILIGTISVEQNELLSTYLTAEGIRHTILNAKNHEQEGEIIADAGEKGAVTIATNMAGRGIDIKLGGIDATEEQKEEIKSFGGLFVLGTERHEARRIDNQLRGRSGRQGDPGVTQFFVSMEDDLMRVFGGERIAGLMERMKIPEDQPIQQKMITNSIKTSQTRIEGFHFDSRKHTLEYDDVLSTQRNTIYKRRRLLLQSGDEGVEHFLHDLLNGDTEMAEMIGKKRNEVPDDAFLEAVRRIGLYTTDLLWIDHLETMDYTKRAVNLRSYGQRDPLIEYKKEGLGLFKNLEETFRREVIEKISRLQVDMVEKAIQSEEVVEEKKAIAIHESQKGFSTSSNNNAQEKDTPSSPVQADKIGRNENVTISKDGEVKEMKYKKAEKMLQEGWVLTKK
ncbi:MAG: preprotein translocase subunit SecA [Flavobacteriaceae bacterium]|jgi:preprotein translocase subunit SecA